MESGRSSSKSQGRRKHEIEIKVIFNQILTRETSLRQVKLASIGAADELNCKDCGEIDTVDHLPKRRGQETRNSRSRQLPRSFPSPHWGTAETTKMVGSVLISASNFIMLQKPPERKKKIKMANLNFFNSANREKRALERNTALQNENSVSVLLETRTVTTPYVISR